MITVLNASTKSSEVCNGHIIPVADFTVASEAYSILDEQLKTNHLCTTTKNVAISTNLKA